MLIINMKVVERKKVGEMGDEEVCSGENA